MWNFSESLYLVLNFFFLLPGSSEQISQPVGSSWSPARHLCPTFWRETSLTECKFCWMGTGTRGSFRSRKRKQKTSPWGKRIVSKVLYYILFWIDTLESASLKSSYWLKLMVMTHFEIKLLGCFMGLDLLFRSVVTDWESLVKVKFLLALKKSFIEKSGNS